MRLLVLLGRIICISFILFLVAGCSPYYGINATERIPTDPSITCKEYILSIPTFWHEKEEGYYEFIVDSLSFYGGFVQNTNICFHGLSSKQIKQHLGNPNMEGSTQLTYYVSKACLTRDRDCDVQIFKIENGFFKETLLIAPKRYKG